MAGISYRSGSQPRGSDTNPPPTVPRSTLDRSFRHSTTANAANLIPVYVDEVLPGDTIRLDPTVFARLLSPLEVPSLDDFIIDMHAFFVPNRLVYENWRKLMGERTNPTDHNDYLVPTITPPVDGLGFRRHSLEDYFGIRTETDNLEPMALFHRAYQTIWNEFYRDENLQDSIVVPLGNGPDAAELYELLPRGKRKDYITGSLPFTQKGDAVQIPIGATAPLVGTGVVNSLGSAPTFSSAATTNTGTLVSGSNNFGNNVDNAINSVGLGQPLTWGDPQLETDLGGNGGYADLANAVGITINDFRELVATQHLLEADARGGTRYTSLLQSHFGVTPEDARLQRPEFLWAHSQNMSTHVVPATAAMESFSSTNGLARLGAYAQGVSDSRGFTKSFNEHGMVMMLLSIRAPLRYQQNMPRMFKRSNRFDYYFPEFALLGEQPVYNYEVFADGTAADDDVFGYQPRYEEYRRRESVISGALRSDDPLSLDVFHLAQDFGTRPALDADFIVENPPVDRVTAVNEEAQFILDINCRISHVRPMPVMAKPGLLRL